MKRVIFLLLALGATWGAGAQGAQGGERLSNEEYIAKWCDAAVADMERYGIPASIKLAQGMLESDNGNSRLARVANNHFGIKCKSDWRGRTLSHDDDAPGECFRSYASAEESWRDHSEFLDKGDRYAFLFELDPTDYKGWAEGLKRAGYATNPKYPQLLVKLIEDNQLHLYDTGEARKPTVAAQPESMPAPSATPRQKPTHPNVTGKGGDGFDPDNFTIVAKPN